MKTEKYYIKKSGPFLGSWKEVGDTVLLAKPQIKYVKDRIATEEEWKVLQEKETAKTSAKKAAKK